MEKTQKKWIYICILGGLLMIIGSVVGSVAFFALVFGIASQQLGPEMAFVLSIILIIFAIIAMGGGVSVIIGALIVTKDKYKLGKFIIGLGAGMGLIGLVIFLITTIITGAMLGVILGLINGGFGFFGVVLTIIARFKLKLKKD